MAVTNTTYYNLAKPDGTEHPAPTAFNSNADIIDAELYKLHYYGTCTTAATTAAKVVTCSGFALATGAEIEILFTYGNTATSPTLNINSTGAKSIAGAWSNGQLVRCRYDGTNYIVVAATVNGLWTKIRDIVDTTGTTISVSVSDIDFSVYKKIKLIGRVSSARSTASDTVSFRVNGLSAAYSGSYLKSGAAANIAVSDCLMTSVSYLSKSIDFDIDLTLDTVNGTLSMPVGLVSDYTFSYIGSALMTLASLSTINMVSFTTSALTLTGCKLWGVLK